MKIRKSMLPVLQPSGGKEEVEALLGKTVEWVGRHPEEKYAERYGPEHEGWYTRVIGGKPHLKILLGGV